MRTAAIVVLGLALVGGLVVGLAAQDIVKEVAVPVFKPGPGIVVPVLIKEVKPVYTTEAKKAGIQGRVPLECVVLPDGTVGKVRVVKSLDPGLDEAAVTALKKWTFKPGTKDGQPVAVTVEVEMTFSVSPGGTAIFPVAPIKLPGR